MTKSTMLMTAMATISSSSTMTTSMMMTITTTAMAPASMAITTITAAATTAVVPPEIPRGEIRRYPLNGSSFCMEVSQSIGSAPTGGSSASTAFSQETIAAIASGDS
jgi:hypothetical protein